MVTGATVLGGVANVAPVAMAAYAEHQTEVDIAKYFGAGDIRRAKNNPAVRARLKKAEDNIENSVFDMIFSIVLGAAGGWLIGFLIPLPIPFLSMIGMAVGGIGGSYFYNEVIKDQAQDPIVINQQIIEMRKAGQEVPAEVVFACLAANVSGKAGKDIDSKLKRYTGETLFTEVLGNPNKVKNLPHMMSDPNIDNILRAKYQIPLDPQNPSKTVAEQYMELLNSGKLEPQNLLNIGSWQVGFPSVNIPPANNLAQASPEVPLTPIQAQVVQKGG